MKNTRQKICTTIRDLKLYLVDILSVRAQKIKSTNSTNFIRITYLFLIFYLYKKSDAIYQEYKRQKHLNLLL